MTSLADASNTVACQNGSQPIANPLAAKFEKPDGTQITMNVKIENCYRFGSVPCSPDSKAVCGKMLKVKRYDGPGNTQAVYEMNAIGQEQFVDVEVNCNPATTATCVA